MQLGSEGKCVMEQRVGGLGPYPPSSPWVSLCARLPFSPFFFPPWLLRLARWGSPAWPYFHLSSFCCSLLWLCELLPFGFVHGLCPVRLPHVSPCPNVPRELLSPVPRLGM